MAEIVNLRLARKAKNRAQASAKAEEARALHGQTKGERSAGKADLARLHRALDGAKREND